MTHHYTQNVARHYSAYRPPLHRRILSLAISDERRLDDGLDVGCGTGRSAIALAEFCERVVAIDPSQAMLDASAKHRRIKYLVGSGENIPLSDGSVDVVTFAGSLFYADIDSTSREVTRVCKEDAWVVVYDFDVLIDEVLESFGIAKFSGETNYDHSIRFSDSAPFLERCITRDRIQMPISPGDLAHLLLADSARYESFASRYNDKEPFASLASDLTINAIDSEIEVDIYFSVYQVI